VNIKKEVKFIMKKIGTNGYGADKARRVLKKLHKQLLKKSA
jgi:hypothetical protein